MPRSPSLKAGTRLAFKRSGFAAILFAMIRPRDAKAAAVNEKTLTLTFTFRSIGVPVEDIKMVMLGRRWHWRAVKIRYANRESVVSGLSRDDARTLCQTLEAARVFWWRKALAAQGGPLQAVHGRPAQLADPSSSATHRIPDGSLRAVHGRLAQLADPPCYTTQRIVSDLRRDAEAATGGFPGPWPDTLSNTPELLMLRELRSFLHDPIRFRTKANQTYLANELKRSREFFDSVEARPLTDEQRRAVVVDEHRNLVVAAAGSGKTSVIVAKAGWLVHRGYRRPSELLLLAFARDAQKEMAERIRDRLGAEVVRGITVRTFHSLGMSIIGQAEGKSPTLARVAEDNRALLDLLRQIVAELLKDPKNSRILMKWFQDQFVPYKSEHEFRTYGEYWDYIRRYEILSLKGEQVKSFEECEIANFLYLNGVPYEYERAYEHDTATSEKRQYQPDFYLPDAGIYIEHFALSESGNTPPFINQEEYLRSREWKRQLHAEHGTTLVETYSHEAAAGKLTENLGCETERAWRRPVSDTVRRRFRCAQRTGPDRSVHAAGRDLPAALQGVPADVFGIVAASRHGCWPLASRGVRVRFQADLRALPGDPLRAWTDRLPRHDQQGDGPCDVRAVSQPLRLHPGR